MNIKKRDERDRKLVEYRKSHTLFETALAFDISVNQVYRICKKSQKDD